ncbi:MAG: VOC family protein [Ruminococcus sp.]
MLREQLNGIQHVGIPTNDIEATIEFYGKLGFEVALQTVNEEANEKVAFLKLNNLVIETYENKAAKMESGAIDHVAIDVKDIEKVYELINQADLNTTRDIIHFFTILGKWCQIFYN